MDVGQMKALLRSAGEPTFSRHFEEPKVRIRNITKDEVKAVLGRPDALCLAEDQGDDRRGHKYLLLFGKSSRYDLKVVVSLSAGKINVITAHVQNKKRRRAYGKWL